MCEFEGVFHGTETQRKADRKRKSTSQHYDPDLQIQDAQRTAVIEARNLKVMRIPNNAIKENFRGVCEYIDNCVHERLE